MKLLLGALCTILILASPVLGKSCTLTVGTSSITFTQSSDKEWNIDSMVCDGIPFHNWAATDLNKTHVMSGGCWQLGDTDYDLYWKFFLGMKCYPQYEDILLQKADATLTAKWNSFAPTTSTLVPVAAASSR